MQTNDALADLADVVLNLARELRHRTFENADAIDLTMTEGNVMRFIDRHPGSTARAVASGTGLQRSNLSTVLRVLEQKELVERREDTTDGRGVVLYPTARSVQNLAIIRGEWASHLETALDGQLDGLEQTLRFLTNLDDRVIEHRQQ